MSYSYADPSEQVRMLVSGSTSLAALRIHVALRGITDASDRSVDAAFAWPPPTSVHIGW